MSEKKELNVEQLEKVTGGKSWGEEKSEFLPSDHGEHIGANYAHNHEGKEFYIVNDADTQIYYWGKLESSDGTLHLMYVRGHSDYSRSENIDNQNRYFFASEYTLFLKNSN